MSGEFDVKADLLSKPGDLPLRVRVASGGRASKASLGIGVMIIVVGFFIWTGEIPIALLFGSGTGPNIALATIAVGTFMVLRGVFFRRGTREFEVTSDEVRQTAGSGRGWSEPLSNFRGVRWRRLVGREEWTRHVVELVHADPARTIPLYSRASGRANARDTLKLVRDAFAGARSGKVDEAAIRKEGIRLARQKRGADVRDVWEGLAALLGVPAIDARDGEEEIRAVADLDKSIGELAGEGKASRAWDDRSAPASLDVERIDDDGNVQALQIRFLASALPWMIWPISLGMGGIMLLIGVLNLQIGMLFGAALFIAIPFGVRRFELKSPRSLTITRQEIRYHNPMKQGRTREDFAMALSEVERIHIGRRDDQEIDGRMVSRALVDRIVGKELILSSDNWERRIGRGLDDRALYWLRDYLVAAIANA